MSSSDTALTEAAALFHVNRGLLDSEELAALAVVLYSRFLVSPASGSPRPAVRWQRLERSATFANPRSWHQGSSPGRATSSPTL